MTSVGSFCHDAESSHTHGYSDGNVNIYLQVQIRPWNLSDSDFVMDGSQPLDPRKTIFVGGVPRPLRAGMIHFWHSSQASQLIICIHIMCF